MNDFLETIRRNQEMLERVVGSMARTAQEINRRISSVQATYENLVSPVIRMANDMARMMESLRRRSQKFAVLIQKLKWPPPGHLPSRVIDRIVQAHESGQLSDIEVEELFIKAYSTTILTEIEQRWASYGWLADRLPILRESLANYLDGRFHSVVCTLMPQFEGLIGTEFGRKPRPVNDAPEVFRDSPFGTIITDYFLQVIFENFDGWEPTKPVPDLSRHAILHGRATGYGTKPHAIKLIIVMDYLLQSLDARRNGDDASAA